VNLIGEHTDYNLGLALPCAVDRDTIVLGSLRPDRCLRVVSEEMGGEVACGLDDPPRRDWSDYPRAAFSALEEAGYPCSGAELLVTSHVPREAGLSSSAALGVATMLLLERLLGLGLSAKQVAQLAHRAESHFVGVGCGILDPYASALGRRDHALLIDCQERSVELVPFRADVVLLVARSGVTRALARGGYAERVAECRSALSQARSAGVGGRALGSLSELASEALPELRAALPDLLFRRVRHVIRENARVLAFRRAFEAGDLAEAGALLREGHASLRDDFEVSVPELDFLCASADRLPGVYGSRLVGAGFGGCSLHLVAPEAASQVSAQLTRDFREQFGRDPRPLVLRAAAGASELLVADLQPAG